MKIDQERVDSLIIAAKGGDIDSFSEVYDILLNPIYRFVYFRIPSEEEAEDITSEVFLKAWKNLSRYKKQDNLPFSSWLFRIAHNEVVDFYRKKKETVELPEDDIIPDKNLDIEKDINNMYDRKKLESALLKIPKHQSEVIILKFFSELENKEISTIINKSETAIRILQSRGLKALKKLLDE